MLKTGILKRFLHSDLKSVNIHSKYFSNINKHAYKITFIDDNDSEYEFVETNNEILNTFLDYLYVKTYNKKIDYIDIDKGIYNLYFDGMEVEFINENYNTEYDNSLSYFMKRLKSSILERFNKLIEKDKIKNIIIFQTESMQQLYDRENKLYELNVSYDIDKYKSQIETIEEIISTLVNKYGVENVDIEKKGLEDYISDLKITIKRVIHTFDRHNSNFKNEEDNIIINVKGVYLINQLSDIIDTIECKKEKKLKLKEV